MANNAPLLWDLSTLTKRKDAQLKELPPVPETGWKKPTEFPNLSDAWRIGYDLETKDKGLNDSGPGWARKHGHIVGVSIAAEDRRGNQGAWYFPIRHEVEPWDNMDVNNVLDFARHTMAQPTIKVGANLTYDVGWGAEEGIFPAGELNDVQFAEALIDSEEEVNLEHLARKYLKEDKYDQPLIDWWRKAYPHTPEKFRRRDIYRTPPRLIGHYAERDGIFPLRIFDKQKKILEREQLDYVYRLECDLIILMVKMRRAGIRVDLDLAAQMRVKLIDETALLYEQVKQDWGRVINSTSTAELGPLFEMHGIDVPRSEESGNYSVRKEWLAGLDNPLGALINDIREHEKIVSTFIDGYIFKKNVGGFLFPSFHQLKGDENGTMVGRFASSMPNLQNIPSRTKLGKAVRTLFVPDVGHSHWRKHDYSQIHYRILAHYAIDKGDGSADELRRRYSEDPSTDYHLDVYKKVAPLLGWNTDYTLDAKGEFNEEIKFRRRPVKNVNFGLLYGQSLKSLMYKAGFSEKEGEGFIKAYFDAAPYVRPTMEEIGREVQKFGYVTTLLGRRVRFHLFEPVNKKRGVIYEPLPQEQALRKWGSNIQRAFEYRGVNYKFQGSEPDIMKHGMRDLDRSGVFEFTGVPRVTVHDELDFSVSDDSPQMREAFDFIQHTMQETVKLRIPVKVDASMGPSWGKAD